MSVTIDGPWKSASRTMAASAEQRRKREKKSILKKQSLASLKRTLHYDGDVPRCETCTHFRKAGQILIDSLPRHIGSKCKKHTFNVRPVGCCDDWHGKDGMGLEPTPTSALSLGAVPRPQTPQGRRCEQT